MSPFRVQRLIRCSEEHYCLPALRQIFDANLRPDDFVLSETPNASNCPFTGTVCHSVRRVSVRGWIMMWLR